MRQPVAPGDIFQGIPAGEAKRLALVFRPAALTLFPHVGFHQHFITFLAHVRSETGFLYHASIARCTDARACFTVFSGELTSVTGTIISAPSHRTSATNPPAFNFEVFTSSSGMLTRQVPFHSVNLAR
jgi:hypothetical protein